MAALLETDDVKFIQNKDPNRPLSRYNKIRFLLTREDRFVDGDPVAIQETWDPPFIPELPQDKFFEVPKEFEHRLDLVSLEVYGTESLYWVIAYANKMTDPFAQCTVRRKLRIPDRENLFHTVLAR